MTMNSSSPKGNLQNAARLPGPLRIYLVRHGETAWSVSGQYTGRTDIPLTTRGEDAARELGARIRNVEFTRVLTSPLQRARRTCELARLSTPSETEPDLTEWDHGDDEGRLPADVLKAKPAWNLFQDGSPHGETPGQIAARTDRFMSKLRLMAGNVALFSHGHFGRALAARWIGLTVGQAQHLLLETASLSVLCYERDRIDEPAIALWNSAAPLAFDLPSETPIGDTKPVEEAAIGRWRNQGKEIPTVPSVRADLWGHRLPTAIPYQLNQLSTRDTRPFANRSQVP
jgi:broad specificity phosphatase PhoE